MGLMSTLTQEVPLLTGLRGIREASCSELEAIACGFPREHYMAPLLPASRVQHLTHTDPLSTVQLLFCILDLSMRFQQTHSEYDVGYAFYVDLPFATVPERNRFLHMTLGKNCVEIDLILNLKLELV